MCTVALDDDTTYLLRYGTFDEKTEMNALAQLYASNVTLKTTRGADNLRRLGQLIAGAVDLGMDLHESADGISPLLRILQGKYEAVSFGDKEARLNAWLALLKSIGVDLRLYGQEEWHRFQALRRECDRPWDWWHGTDDHQCQDYPDDVPGRSGFQFFEYIPTLAAFTYGEEVSDWKLWILHPGDHHAGQFWRLIERNGIYSRHVPGGWVEAE